MRSLLWRAGNSQEQGLQGCCVHPASQSTYEHWTTETTAPPPPEPAAGDGDQKCESSAPPLPARPHDEPTQHKQPPPLHMLNFAKPTEGGAVIVSRSSKRVKMSSTQGSNVATHRSTSWAGTCLTSLS